jgi:hypothetical protein
MDIITKFGGIVLFRNKPKRNLLKLFIATSCVTTLNVVPVLDQDVSKGNFLLANQVSAATQIFKDVPSNFWAYKEIEWGKKHGLIKGYANGNFNPNGTLTEYQFASMIAHFYPEIDDNGDYYQLLKPYGVPLKGYTDEKAKNKPVKREVVARVLAYLNGQKSDLTNAVKWLSAQGITTATADNFRPDKYLTRAQMITFFHRLIITHNGVIDPSLLPEGQIPITGDIELIPDVPGETAPRGQTLFP